MNTMVSFFVFVGCLTPNPQAAQMIASLGTGIFGERKGGEAVSSLFFFNYFFFNSYFLFVCWLLYFY